jgi:fructokinase
MSKANADLVCFGEALVDLVSTRSGVRLDQAPAFRKAAGGAPANVAVGAARLGCRVAFLGAFGADALGNFLIDVLGRAGVVVEAAARTPRPTAIALVSLAADGDRDFLFYGHEPAHLDLRLTTTMRAIIRRAHAFHFGSISLIADPARHATLEAIAEARRAGALCSFDPNLRLNLWPNARVARGAIRAALPLADIVKVNEAELAFLTGCTGISAGLRALCAEGPQLALVTLGPQGCAYRTADSEGKVPGFAARVVDTTGAGDAFTAGLLAGLLTASASATAPVRSPQQLEGILVSANAVAALSTERRGGIPSLPRRARVQAFLQAHKR